MALEHEELTGAIIGAAITVHRELGPGFLESVYGNALALELRARGIAFAREVSVPVVYRGTEVGTHRLDLFVGEEVVTELKAIKHITHQHFAVVRSYLRAAGKHHGLLLNFATTTLEAKRVIVPHAQRCSSSRRP
jgi:GxxExxY protein